MRALGRCRWLVPALAIPTCAVAAGVMLQAASFGRPAKDALVATAALRELDRYHVMRGVQSLGGPPLQTTCMQGSFRLPGQRRPAHGALVLLGNGERLYDVGFGVRRLLRLPRSRPAGLADRIRFVLAACPRYVDDQLATELVRGRPVEAFNDRSDGASAAAIVTGSRRATLTLDVSRVTHAPLALSFSDGRLRGSTDLVPGGGAAAIRRVRDAFDLDVHQPRARA